MASMSPIMIALGIIAAVALVGVALTFKRQASVFAGYESLRPEMQKIAAAIHGEIFRDFEDVVISGTRGSLPVQVRFSIAENTPGLNIRMQAKVPFTFSVVPKGARATEGRVLVRTGDDMFDARFAARTDHPTQAKMLVSSKAMRTQMEKLCCSSKTYLTLVSGNIELSELVIPEPYTSRHVTDHVESMAVLGRSMEEMPGSEDIKIVPYQREKSAPVFRLVVGAAAIITLAFVFTHKPTKAMPSSEELGGNSARAVGIMPSDAAVIPGASDLHVLRQDEMDPGAKSFLASGGSEPSGRIELDLGGDPERKDVAYALMTADGNGRVVLLRDNVNIYDTQFSGLLGIGKVPQDRFASTDWKYKPTSEATTDAVLILNRNATTNEIDGVVVYPGSVRVLSAIPTSYQYVSVD